MEADKEDVIKIDIKQLLLAVVRRIWIVILAAIIGGSGMMIYTATMVEPVYTSSAKIQVLDKTEDKVTNNDVQSGAQLVNDYKIIISSRPVLEKVVEELGLEISPGNLANMVKISIPTDTRVIILAINYNKPDLAKAILDKMIEVSSARIATLGLPIPNIIENGSRPTAPVSPDKKKSAVTGALASGVMASGICILLYFMEGIIKDTNDIQKYLELKTLAAIPWHGDKKKKNLRKKNKKFKKKNKKKRKEANK